MVLFARVPFTLTTFPNHLSFLVIFTLQDGVCQGSLHPHNISKPSVLPRDLYPARWCLSGFPSLSQHIQTIWPSSRSLPCKMVFARVPFTVTTCPNHLAFLVIFTLQDGVCQGFLHPHNISKPSGLPRDLYPARWCFPGFPSLSQHFQTIWPSS